MVKKIIRLSILQILKIIGNISVNIYKLFFYKNEIRYTSPSVQTYGDALKHYQYVILLSKYYKKDYHVISINREPCKSILPFFFKKENYSFYNEFIYCFFKKKDFLLVSKKIVKILLFKHLYTHIVYRFHLHDLLGPIN